MGESGNVVGLYHIILTCPVQLRNTPVMWTANTGGELGLNY